MGERSSEGLAESSGDTYHATRDDQYLRQLREEAEFWDRPHFFNLDVDLPVIDSYQNERFTGDKSVAWYETIPSYGTFRRGCALGAGGLRHEARILALNPSLHLTFYDISGESLAKRERQLGTQFPGRVATCQADLNFVELPENAYDLIVSSAAMHHLLNLEHIAYQIDRSLTPDGLFFLHDYVAEARFQFAEEKKRLFEVVVEEARARHPFLRSWRIQWSDPSNWEHSPFEAVRSDETLEILRRYLTEVALRTASPLLGLVIFLKPVAPPAHPPLAASGRSWPRRVRSIAARLRRRLGGARTDFRVLLSRLGPDLLPLDRALCDAGIFRPWNAFAVYRKGRSAGPPAD